MTTNHTPHTPPHTPGPGGSGYPAGFGQPAQPGGYTQPGGAGPGAGSGTGGSVTAPHLPPAPLNPSDTDCPCGHGDIVAEIAAQRPLLKRTVAGRDAGAFAQLYDEHVDGVYRYAMGWTGDHATSSELVEQVFRGAITWLPVIIGGEGDLGAWLITMTRDTIGQQRGNSAAVGVPVPAGGTVDLPKAVAQLDDAQREVVILRLLLGHSLAHTAHLAGYSERVVLELQVAACATMWRLTGGAPVQQDGREEWRAQEFQRHIADWTVDFTGVNDPGLRDMLTVTAALRRIAPEWVAGPDEQFVDHLRGLVINDASGGRSGRKDPRNGAAAGVATRAGAGGGGLGNPFRLARGPWIITFLVGIVIVAFLAAQIASRLGTKANNSSSVSTQGAGTATTSAASGGGGGGVTITTLGTGSTSPSASVIIPGTTRGTTATTSGGATTSSSATATTRRATTTSRRATTTSTTTTTTTTTTPTTTTLPPST